jgi:aldose 1-epimerase
LPIDETSIPTGEFREVKDSPFDFRKPKPIGRDIEKEDRQLKRGNGYDYNWVLRGRENE